jgi:hypothetical protein
MRKGKLRTDRDRNICPQTPEFIDGSLLQFLVDAMDFPPTRQ